MATRRMTPSHVGEQYGVTPDTVRAWIAAGLLPATNVARPTATRPRWRMSEADLAEFEANRTNTPTAAVKRKRRRRSKPAREFV